MAVINISGYHVYVDDEDIPRISQHKWRLHRSRKHIELGIYYFISSACKRTGMPAMRLHRFILNYWGNLSVDHINRNTLDCRKENLRIVPQQTNIYNRCVQSNCSSGNRGIYYTNSKWHVSYIIEGKRIVYAFKTKEIAQCIAKYIIENMLSDREVNCIEDTYGDLPGVFSDEATRALDIFINRTLRGLRADKTNRYRGVYLNKNTNKWKYVMHVKNVQYTNNNYNTPEEAAIARDRLAYKLLGDKAKLNFPERIAEYTLTTT